MSLAAALLVSVGAHAMELGEFSGDARLYYGTADMGSTDLFHKDGAMGNAAVSADLGLTFSDSVVGNFGITYLTTMGLEESLVSSVWAGGLKDQFWLDEANLAFSVVDKTSMVVGRQYLDTPLVFSETWNIVSNAFDAAVLVDQHLPSTTLVGAWIGRTWNNAEPVDAKFGGEFTTFGKSGAYAVGASTTIIPSVELELWYYGISGIATAFWAEAETEFSGIALGAQFASLSPKSGDDTTAFAGKIGYSVEDSFSVAAAFSQVSEDGVLNVQNSAGLAGFGQSPLYTEAWWNFGYVGAPDTTSYALLGETGLGRYDVGIYFTSANNDAGDMMDLTLTAGSSIGAFDYAVAYIMTDADNQNDGDAYNTLQAYLTYNF
ncbi:MAG: hypothetical protein DSZ03_01075 [Sulfurimonas sp.]|nr:MAG: hypothetical protein DSZ03_01075 [Sulfurimonas sp.]